MTDTQGVDPAAPKQWLRIVSEMLPLRFVKWIEDNFTIIREKEMYYLVGDVDPEGNVVADVGTIYVNRLGTVGNVLFVKEDDNGLATGWVAK